MSTSPPPPPPPLPPPPPPPPLPASSRASPTPSNKNFSLQMGISPSPEHTSTTSSSSSSSSSSASCTIKQEQQQQQQQQSTSNAVAAAAAAAAANYYYAAAVANYNKQQIDLNNNNSNNNTNNQVAALQQQQQHYNQQIAAHNHQLNAYNTLLNSTNTTTVVNNSNNSNSNNNCNNSNNNSNSSNNNNTGGNNNLIANLNAANFANFVNLAAVNNLQQQNTSNLHHSNQQQQQQQQQQQHHNQQQQHILNGILNGLNQTNPTSPALLAAAVNQQQQQQQQQLLVNGAININDEHQLYEYMHQLLEEKEKLKELFNEPFNILLPISARLLDEEISRIRVNLFQLGGKEIVCLPEPVGPPMTLTEKLYVPVKDHPEFNFVGRILGPRGMTAKQLEQETGCKIMVRGKGSMRDKAKEEQMKGKPNWEHLNDELHVLITVEDTKNRADLKLKRAVEEIKRLLVPAPEGEDELKKKQLMELAIINGTYRDSSKLQQKMNQILIPGNSALAAAAAAAAASNGNGNGGGLGSPPNPLGQPLIISPRLAAAAVANHQAAAAAAAAANNSNTAASILNGNAQASHHHHHHQLITQSTDPSTGLIYTTIPAIYSDHAAALSAAAASQLLDYPNGIDFSQAGSIKPQRFSTVGSATMRAHPYARVALS